MGNYLGPALLDVEHPGWALPGMAADLAGFPRTYVENCEMDGLRASGERFTGQLAAAGVGVEQHAVPGELHGHLNVPGLPGAFAAFGYHGNGVSMASWAGARVADLAAGTMTPEARSF